MKNRIVAVILSAALVLSACGQAETAEGQAPAESTGAAAGVTVENTEVTLSPLASNNTTQGSVVFDEINSDELFSNRDLSQTADLSEAEYLTVTDGEDIVISAAGVYVLSGEAAETTVIVDADSQDKVQLVLDGLVISNTDAPCIYVKSADKVFITTASDGNSLTVSDTFAADGDVNTDAAVFSKDDLVLNGTGTLTITSSDNGISGKDGIKITGGTLQISCEGSAIEANDEILAEDGIITIDRCNDGFHAENDEDDTVGYIYIGGGTINITAADDALHATTLVKIDDGELTLTGAEAIEGTAIQINGGTVTISATDDGINAAQKSSAYSPLFELNGGTVTIEMGAGDTDGVDSNGDIIINGGTISINGMSTFDYDGTAQFNGGTIIENGEETDTISNQFGGGMGGFGPMGGEGGRNGRMPGGDGTRQDFGMKEGADGTAAGEGMQAPDGSAMPAAPEFPEGTERPAMQPPADGTQGQEMMPPEGFERQGRPHGMGRPEDMPYGAGQNATDQ